MKTLRMGDSGPEVVALQDRLRQKGFNSSGGTFDIGTKAAVIGFQKSEGLVADGVVGPRTAAALGLVERAEIPSVIPGFTVEVVTKMFPATPRRNIEQHLPAVLTALVEPQLTDKQMVLMALATIRAETESFQPISEGKSQFNSSASGHPFDLYDSRKDLGNTGPPDGERFRGRGFIQLTGRSNYNVHGAAIGLGNQLLENPDQANESDIAARLLASFIKSKEVQIKHALLEGDLKAARRLVNGGSHGLDRFTDAYRIGDGIVPETLDA